MSSLCLLIIDSSKRFHKTAQQFLLRKGSIKRVETAGSAQEALEMAREVKPDVILVELELLKKADPFFCQQLKAEAPGTIVIGLTLFNHGINITCPLDSHGIDVIVSREHFAENIMQIIRSLRSESTV